MSFHTPYSWKNYQSLTEATLLNKIKDNDFLNFGSASDKYKEFIKRYPDVALQVPQQYIASYLKITPQYLAVSERTLPKKSSKIIKKALLN